MKNFLNHNILIHFNFKFSEQVKHTYLFCFLRAILMVSGGLFIPYYIFKILGFYYTILYQLLFSSIFRILASLTVKNFLKKYGLERAYFISILAFIIQMLLLKFIDLKQNPYLIFLLAFFASFSIVYYWVPLHLSISLFGSIKRKVEEKFFVDLLISIVKAIFPFLSSILIVFIGFRSFFGLIALVILVLVLYLLSEFKKTNKITKINLRIKRKPDFKALILFFFEGFYIILALLFYLVLVSSYSDLKDFGFLLSLSNILTLLLSFYLSRRIDKFKDYTLAIVGFLLLISLYLHIYFATSIRIISLAFLTNGIILSLINTPYIGWFYSLLKKKGAEQLYYKEFVLILSYLIGYGVIILLRLDLFKAFYIFTLIQILFALIFYFVGKKFEIQDELTSDFLKHFSEIKIKEK
jgi:hypothetical protein